MIRLAYEAGIRGKTEEKGMFFLGVLIVCSVNVFYVITTHCFSSTYGWLPGMCFLSLVLMTWVTSLTLHMLVRRWTNKDRGRVCCSCSVVR